MPFWPSGLYIHATNDQQPCYSLHVSAHKHHSHKIAWELYVIERIASQLHFCKSSCLQLCTCISYGVVPTHTVSCTAHKGTKANCSYLHFWIRWISQGKYLSLGSIPRENPVWYVRVKMMQQTCWVLISTPDSQQPNPGTQQPFLAYICVRINHSIIKEHSTG